MNKSLKTPSLIYFDKKQSEQLLDDSVQLALIKQFDQLAIELVAENKRRNSFIYILKNNPHLVKGLYLWGSVGVGKTMLMDCFYEGLSIKNKKRIHFHQFMLELHSLLKKHAGKKDPVKFVAEDIAKKTFVLCFDEFFVNDIADAMLIAKVFEYLFEFGVCLVATSNVPPEQLYKNGLQRQNFVPTIELLKEKVSVIHLAINKDYRREFFSSSGVYYTPLNHDTTLKMKKAFELNAKGKSTTESIELYGRAISVISRSSNAIWFDFKNICGVPRSQNDYIQLANQYDYLFVSNITVIESAQRDLIVSFIHLVDVLYDAKVKLVLSAEVLPQEIYQGGLLNFPFQRTQSRLQEMQSEAYFYGADKLV